MMRYFIYIMAFVSSIIAASAQPIGVRGVMENYPMASDDMTELSDRLDFYVGNNYNTYFYAPSDDRYRSEKGWKFLYTEPELSKLDGVRRECERRGLRFVWTINPGAAYKWTEDDYKYLLNKLVLMYYRGVRNFAIDFSGAERPEAEEEHALLERLVADFVSKRAEPVSVVTVRDLGLVRYPHAGSTPETLMLGKPLPQNVIRTAKRSDAVLCKVEENDELSKLTICELADFAMNPSEYDPAVSRANAIGRLAPEVKEAYLTFAKHSGGDDESADVEIFTLDTYTDEKYEALMEEFRRIEAVPHIMGKCASRTFLSELQAWLIEFGRLGARGRKTLECLSYYRAGELGYFWKSYVDNQMSAQDKASYAEHRSGSKKLQPFYENMMQELAEAFSEKMTGSSTLKTLSSAGDNAALDSDFLTSVFCNGRLVFRIPENADRCYVLLGDLPDRQTVYIRQLDAKGKLCAEFSVKSPYIEMELKPGSVKVDVIGNVEVFETIFVSLRQM